MRLRGRSDGRFGCDATSGSPRKSATTRTHANFTRSLVATDHGTLRNT